MRQLYFKLYASMHFFFFGEICKELSLRRQKISVKDYKVHYVAVNVL